MNSPFKPNDGVEQRVVARTASWAEAEPHWIALEEQSRERSFFLRAGWVSAWMEVFAASLQPTVLLFESGDRVVGTCLLVSATEKRGPFRIRSLYLNTSGEDLLDRSTMEFNSVLCLPGFETPVVRALLQNLERRSWDECIFEGVSEGPVLDALLRMGMEGCTLTTQVKASRYVDLARLRHDSTGYEGTLSSNTRSQIRRSLRLYETRGALQVVRGSNPEEASAYFDELTKLHQRRWLEAGEPGAFASERKIAFHRALIRRGVADGTADVLRIAAGDTTIGVLYNFVDRGKVYFYQSGLCYESEPRLKPGLVSHFLAIAHYQRQGLDEYDFMAGDLRYKRSLATGERPLCWVTIQRRGARMRLIELLRVARRRLRGRMASAASEESS